MRVRIEKKPVEPVTLNIGDVVVIGSIEYLIVTVEGHTDKTYRLMNLSTCNVNEGGYVSMSELIRLLKIDSNNIIYKKNNISLCIEE